MDRTEQSVLSVGEATFNGVVEVSDTGMNQLGSQPNPCSESCQKREEDKDEMNRDICEHVNERLCCYSC